mgnify:CR=1 FL=1
MVLYDLGVEKDFHFLYFEDVKGEDGGGADSFISAAAVLWRILDVIMKGRQSYICKKHIWGIHADHNTVHVDGPDGVPGNAGPELPDPISPVFQYLRSGQLSSYRWVITFPSIRKRGILPQQPVSGGGQRIWIQPYRQFPLFPLWIWYRLYGDI